MLICLLLVLGSGCDSRANPAKTVPALPIQPGSSAIADSESVAPAVQASEVNNPVKIRLWVLDEKHEVPANQLPKYDRKTWRHWVDQDGDCQNTRVEVLIEEAKNDSLVMSSDGCKVISGAWQGLYTLKVFEDPQSLDIDHLIPLANAHKSGGWAWDSSEKRIFANDLSNSWHLLAVESSANRSKGSKGPGEWRPKNKDSWCRYAKEWSNIKSAYRLWVTADEAIALEEMLSACPADDVITIYKRPVHRGTIESLLKGFSQETTNTSNESSSSPKYDPLGPDKDCSDFKQWGDAQGFYIAAGGPAVDRHRLDGNKDGIACNSLRGAPKN